MACGARVACVRLPVNAVTRGSGEGVGCTGAGFARHQDQLNQLQQRFAKSSAAAHMMFRMAAEDDAIGEIVATATSPKKEITSR